MVFRNLEIIKLVSLSQMLLFSDTQSRIVIKIPDITLPIINH